MSAHAEGTDSLIAVSLSDVGRTRKENQDACGEFHNSLGERLLITADGMGGHTAGATASRLCVEAMGRVFASCEGSPAERLRLGFEDANQTLRNHVEKNPELEGMGTTGVALLYASDGTCWLAWVGDSRAYRYRDGQLVALSEDHSLVGEWVRDGVISAEEAEVHPRRNELMRAIGPEQKVEVDVKQVELEPGDRFLLCSDGLCGYLSGAEIAAIVGFERPDAAVRKLVDKVNEEHNSPDNVTVQIIEVPRDYDSIIASAAAGAPHPQAVDSERPSEATTHDMETTPAAPGPDAVQEEVEAGSGEEEEAELASSLEGERRTPRVYIYAAAGVVAFTLGWASYYALTTGGGGFPVQEEAALEGPAVPREASAPPIPTAEDLRASARAEERRQRIEEENLALEKSRLERERLRAESAAALEAEAAATVVSPPDTAAATREAVSPPAPEAATKAITSPPAPATATSQRADSSTAPVADVALETFLSEWSRAAMTGDFALYSSLGFRDSKIHFDGRYPAGRNLEVHFQEVRFRPWLGGFLDVHVTEIRSFVGSSGEERDEMKRHFVLKKTPDGLRYVDSRD